MSLANDLRGEVFNYIDSSVQYGPHKQRLKDYILADAVGAIEIFADDGATFLKYKITHLSGELDSVSAVVDAVTRELLILQVQMPTNETRFLYPAVLPL